METLGYPEEERLEFLTRQEPTASPEQLADLRTTLWSDLHIDQAIQMGW